MTTSSVKKSTLTINGLKLHTHLGWSERERSRKRLVLLNITLTFTTPPAACQTDQLEDTICYDTLIALLRKKLGVKKFKLLEHLAAEIYTILHQETDHKLKISIHLTKYPSIDQLSEGVSFYYGDS